MFPTWKPVFLTFEEQTEPNHGFAILVDKLQSILLETVDIENLSNTVVKLHLNKENANLIRKSGNLIRKFKSWKSWAISSGNGVYIGKFLTGKSYLLILVG